MKHENDKLARTNTPFLNETLFQTMHSWCGCEEDLLPFAHKSFSKHICVSIQHLCLPDYISLCNM